MRFFLRFFRRVILGVILAFGVLFSVSNRDGVQVDFFPFPYLAELPAFLLIIICLALGVVIAGLVTLPYFSGLRSRYVAEHRRAEALENELQGLRMTQREALSVTHHVSGNVR